MFLLPHSTAAGFAPTSAMSLPTRQRTVPLSVVLEETLDEDGCSGSTMKSMSSSSHTSNTMISSSSTSNSSPSKTQSRCALRRRPLRLGLVRSSLQQPLVAASTTTTTSTVTTTIGQRNFATAMSLSGQSNTAQQLHLQHEHQNRNRNGSGGDTSIPLRNLPTQHLVSSILEETCGNSVASNGTTTGTSSGNTPSTAALFSPTVVNVYYNPPPKVMYAKNNSVMGKSCKTMMTTTTSSDDVSDDRDEAVVDDVVWELEAAEQARPNSRMERRRETEDAPVMPPPPPSSGSATSATGTRETNQASSPFHISNHNGTGGPSTGALPIDQSVLNFLSQADDAYQRLLSTRDGRISLLQSHGRHMAALQQEQEHENDELYEAVARGEENDDGAADVRLDTFQTFKSSRRLLASEDKEQNGIVGGADDSRSAMSAASQPAFHGVPQDIMRPQWFDISTLTMDATLTMNYETVEL